MSDCPPTNPIVAKVKGSREPVYEVRLNQVASPGDVLPALARLLRAVARRELAAAGPVGETSRKEPGGP
jgi:hypothetical protein